MTSVVVLAAVDRQKRPLLFAVSRETIPDKSDMQKLVETARRFGLGHAVNVVLRKTAACDACGCCDVFPCRDGCAVVGDPVLGQRCLACAH